MKMWMMAGSPRRPTRPNSSHKNEELDDETEKKRSPWQSKDQMKTPQSGATAAASRAQSGKIDVSTQDHREQERSEK
jgi:hypothetical protein